MHKESDQDDIMLLILHLSTMLRDLSQVFPEVIHRLFHVKIV